MDSDGNLSPPIPVGLLPFLIRLSSFGIYRWKVTEGYGPNRSGTLPETTYTYFYKTGMDEQKLVFVLNQRRILRI
jgi:hypothetical protein